MGVSGNGKTSVDEAVSCRQLASRAVIRVACSLSVDALAAQIADWAVANRLED